MKRIIETAKGNYKLVEKAPRITFAINVADKKDKFTFHKGIDELSDNDVAKKIESTIVYEELDNDFLHDDFSWVHDFEQW